VLNAYLYQDLGTVLYLCDISCFSTRLTTSKGHTGGIIGNYYRLPYKVHGDSSQAHGDSSQNRNLSTGISVAGVTFLAHAW
jgi:hypothetical protein